MHSDKVVDSQGGASDRAVAALLQTSTSAPQDRHRALTRVFICAQCDNPARQRQQSILRPSPALPAISTHALTRIRAATGLHAHGTPAHDNHAKPSAWPLLPVIEAMAAPCVAWLRPSKRREVVTSTYFVMSLRSKRWPDLVDTTGSLGTSPLSAHTSPDIPLSRARDENPNPFPKQAPLLPIPFVSSRAARFAACSWTSPASFFCFSFAFPLLLAPPTNRTPVGDLVGDQDLPAT